MSNNIEVEIKSLPIHEVENGDIEKRTDLLKLEDWLNMGEEELEKIYFEVMKDKIYKEKEALKFVFGEKTKIEKIYKEGWLIESTLESRGIVSGGQKVKIKLGDKTSILVDSYAIAEIEINGGKIELPSKVVFYPTKPNFNSYDFIGEKIKEIYGGQKVAEAVLGEKIRLFEFKSAEDLVCLLHECGHQISKNHKVGKENYEFILKSASKLLPGEKISKEDIKTLLLVLKSENEASSSAITMIKNLRKSGVDLFPKDTDLTQVNLFLSLAMSTYLKSVTDNVNLREQIKNLKRFLKFD